MNENDYKRDFGLSPENTDKAEKALEHALDIRKFEISLYWQRATYFWALITVAFAGYFAVLGAEHLDKKEYLAYVISCIGFVFTWAWFLVNRGSKYWQENWENHVDMLEDTVVGPLYKTVLYRSSEGNFIEKFVTGPLAISVSKINQWVSFFTLGIWIALIINTLCTIDIKHIVVGIITLGVCVLMVSRGKTDDVSYDHAAKKRDTKIIDC